MGFRRRGSRRDVEHLGHVDRTRWQAPFAVSLRYVPNPTMDVIVSARNGGLGCIWNTGVARELHPDTFMSLVRRTESRIRDGRVQFRAATCGPVSGSNGRHRWCGYRFREKGQGRDGLWSNMTGMSNDRIAQSLDDSELWSRATADQLLNQVEYRKVHKGLSAREQKRWRHKVATRLWRSFKQEIALNNGTAFTVQDVSEAVIADVKLWLDAEWKVR